MFKIKTLQLLSTKIYKKDDLVVSLSCSLVPPKTCWGLSKLVMFLQLQENERKLHRSLQEVKNVEFELEEAASRKKVHEYLFKLSLIRIH